MGTVSLTDPVSGTVVAAGLFTTNNAALRTVINGGIDNNNVAAAAGIDGSKLANVTRVYNRYGGAAVDVQNTAAETSLYSTTITGGDMGTNRALRLGLSGDFLHNNGAADTVTIRVKLGGSTLLTLTSSLGGTASATRRPWNFNPTLACITNQGANNIQNALLQVIGLDTTGALLAPSTAGTGTVDTSTNQTLDITAQWSAASANNSYKLRQAVVELA